MISCLTVTNNRYKLLLKSIDMFNKQTFEKKEMIIVYYSTDKDTIDNVVNKIKQDNIHFHIYDPKDNLTLGEIRNYSVEKANGDYICIWDDDDIFHPERLQAQFDNLKGYNTCTLAREIKYEIFFDKITITPFREKGWENSLLCKKEFMTKYGKLNLGEDTEMLEKLENVNVIDQPHLYTYIFHGMNTISKIHFDKIGISRLRPGLEKSMRKFLNDVINKDFY
jgi:glycosyltransferase involved in cell wall biosynthesis